MRIGIGTRGEAPRIDFFERAASGKLTMSVLYYVRFLSALERGEIIPKPVVETMKGTSGDRLGFDPSWARNWWLRLEERRLPRLREQGCQTAAMIFPSGIVAYAAVNSKNNGFSGSIQGVLANAFDGALK
ncbi:hypothetical protein BH20ACT13_BH20ACT13_09540 [soil metagenome]